MTEDEKSLEEKLKSTVGDSIMSFVEEFDDQEVRHTRDKIEAFSEQINELDSTIIHMQQTIEKAMDSMREKQHRRNLLVRRAEIERDKLHQLEKLARDYAGE